MSIQLKLGGHSFSRAALPKKAFEDDTAVEFSVLTHKTLLVPKEIFDEGNAANYLSVEGIGCNDDECVVCDFTVDDAVAIMAIDKVCLGEIREIFGERALLVSPLSRKYDAAVKSIYIYITDCVTYFKLYDGGKLRYAEAAKTTDPNDVLYYVALLDGCFGLSDCSAYIEGVQAADTAKLVKPYCKRVKCE